MLKISILSVTESHVRYIVQRYYPGIGWDGGVKKVTLAEWRNSYPGRQPRPGLQFEIR